MKRRWRLRRALAEVACLMRPGYYRLKGEVAQCVEQQPSLFRRFHPDWVAVNALADGIIKHDVAILRDDCVILLSVDRTCVTRLYRDADRARHVVENSQWLQLSFPCPVAAPVDVGLTHWHAVREAFVNGSLLRDADPQLWEPAYRAFLQACRKNAARCEGFLESSSWFEELDGWEIGGRAGAVLAHWRAVLAEILGGAPVVWSHGDAHNGNLVVSDQGELSVIDVERAERQPFFFDALSPPRGSAPVNVQLRRDYLAGLFDAELDEVWQAANAIYRPEWRAAYLLAVVVAQAFRPQFTEQPSQKRRSKLVSGIEKILTDCEERA